MKELGGNVTTRISAGTRLHQVRVGALEHPTEPLGRVGQKWSAGTLRILNVDIAEKNFVEFQPSDLDPFGSHVQVW